MRAAAMTSICWRRSPDLLPSPFALAAISQWYVTTRYPDPDAVSPTIVEVDEALEAVASLIAAIVDLAPPAARRDSEKD
jgi:hypothetical protein